MYRIVTLFLISLLLYACQETAPHNDKSQGNTASTQLSYAKRFNIKKDNDCTILEILGNKNDSSVTATFILYHNSKPETSIRNAYFIKVPVTRVASMSSIYTTMIEKLGVGSTIVAIDNVDYYNNKRIQEHVAGGKIIELSKGPSIEVEKTLALKPDLILSFGMGNPKEDIDAKIYNSGLPVAISLDHLESTPLARYEWIKFIACFFDKQREADSLFQITEQRYTKLTSLTRNLKDKPKVLTEIKYGDTWHVPAGNSYVANLLYDAGADYFWKNENTTGSLALSFETVYAKANNCDVWLNPYNVNSKKELLSYDERYALFNAFKTGRLYNNNKTQNQHGFSNFWEDGITNPDEVLADLIHIFYPDLLPQHKLIYYKKIE